MFVHGHNGSSDDFKAMLDGLVLPSTTTRFDDYRFVGTTDHAAWPTGGIGRRSWLFAFDYYIAKGTDKRGSFTAGPGRVGSNRAKPCASPKGSGALVADDASYDDGAAHDYAEDLASMLADVFRATGASTVDLVAHSLGGFVVRSFLAFYDGGGTHVKTVMLLSSPHQGIVFAPLEALIGQAQPWMAAHELTELAGGGPFAKSSFMRCGDAAGSYSDWPRRLLDQEVAHPIAPTLHVMSGSNDLLVSYDNADHPQAKSHVVVQGVDHPGILKAPATIQRVDQLCGGVLAN